MIIYYAYGQYARMTYIFNSVTAWRCTALWSIKPLLSVVCAFLGVAWFDHLPPAFSSPSCPQLFLAPLSPLTGSLISSSKSRSSLLFLPVVVESAPCDFFKSLIAAAEYPRHTSSHWNRPSIACPFSCSYHFCFCRYFLTLIDNVRLRVGRPHT